MFKKKNKIMYRFLDDSLNKRDTAEHLIKSILVKATPSSSCWLNKMKSRVDGFKSDFDAISKKQALFLKTGREFDTNSGATVKTCPGIMGLFKQLFLIKSPTDIVITVNKKGEFVYDISDPSIVAVSSHEKAQYYQDDNKFFKDKLAVKVVIKASIKTTGFGYMLSDPTYHGSFDFFVPPGLMMARYADNQQLNVIFFIDLPKDKESKTIYIKEGDVICYLIPFEECVLGFSEENFIRQRFNKSFNRKKDYSG